MALQSVATPAKFHPYEEGDRYENGVTALRGIAALTVFLQAAQSSQDGRPAEHVLLDLAGLVRHAAVYAEQEFEADREQMDRRRAQAA